jgi:hypothetical protein
LAPKGNGAHTDIHSISASAGCRMPNENAVDTRRQRKPFGEIIASQ